MKHWNGRDLLFKFTKARILLPFRVVEAALFSKRPDGPRVARATSQRITMLDGRRYRYYDDGSLRHNPPRARMRHGLDQKRWARTGTRQAQA